MPLQFKILYKFLPYVFLVIGLSISIFLGWFTHHYYKEKELSRLELASKDIVHLIQTRMSSYTQVLKSGAGLFNASDNVSRQEWSTFTKAQKTNENFKGIQRLGYAEVVLPQNKQEHEERIRKEGLTNFKIHPDGQREMYTPVIYLEPFDAHNIRAFGYDMFSEKVRREAMTKAMQSGEAVLSDKIKLVHEYNKDIQAGFLMYLPIYKKEFSLNVPQDKTLAIQGFIFASIRADELMNGILGTMFPNIDFEIYDGNFTNQKKLLYDSNTKVESIVYKKINTTINRHAWTITIKSNNTFENNNIYIILLPGFTMILTLFIFLLLKSLIKTRERALKIAKKMTKKLNVSEERLRFALEGTHDGLWDWNLKTNEIVFDDRWADILGYQLSEIEPLLKSWKSRMHPEDLEACFNDIQNHIDNKTQFFKNTHRMMHKDGKWRYILSRGKVVERDKNNLPIRLSGTNSDVTEMKIIELELDKHRYHLEELVNQRTSDLAETQKLAEAANKAKSLFLANMSHEIRTPMNAILGLTHLLQKTELNSSQLEQLKKISSAGEHLLSLINDILDLSKIEAGKLVLEQTNFNLETIVDNIQSQFSQQFKEKGVFLEIEPLSLFPWLIGDPTRLRQALLNYLSNALKFTPNGKVTLRIKQLIEQDHKLLLRFEVHDTGIGLEPDKFKLLFQSFEQADNSTTRKYGGTGLGLPITKRIANLMGGDAGVESEANQGCTFWFSGWFHRGQEDISIPSPLGDKNLEITLRSQYAGSRILLVEDNELNLEVAHDILANVELIVDTASNGLEALEKIEATHYALVLMDVQMPKMDGLEATRRIRAEADNDELPVLAMTAGVLGIEKEACTTAGMNDFVAKPIVLNNLYSRLIKWLPNNRKQPPK